MTTIPVIYDPPTDMERPVTQEDVAQLVATSIAYYDFRKALKVLLDEAAEQVKAIHSGAGK